MYDYRIVTCIDIEASSLEEAYEKLYLQFKTLPKGMEWESSDEAYGPDGEEVEPDELQAARMKVFAKLNP